MRKRYFARQPQEIVPDGMRVDASTKEEVLGVLGFCAPGPAVTEHEEKCEPEEMSTIRTLEDEIVRAWKDWMQSNEERRCIPRGNAEDGPRMRLSGL